MFQKKKNHWNYFLNTWITWKFKFIFRIRYVAKSNPYITHDASNMNFCSFFKYISFVNVRIFPGHISKCAWNSSRLIKTSLAAFYGSFECALCQVFTRRISTDVSPFNKCTSCLSTSHTPLNKFISPAIGPWIFMILVLSRNTYQDLPQDFIKINTITALNKQDSSSQNKNQIYSEKQITLFLY